MKISEIIFFSKQKWYHATTLNGAISMLTQGIDAEVNLGKPRDFGHGLYLCPSYKWTKANAQALIKNSAMSDSSKKDIPVILVFKFRPIKLIKAGCTAKFFPKADKEYADFTISNWKTPGKIVSAEDIIAGPMTRDGQTTVIKNGTDEEISAFFLKPQKGAYQLLLHTKKVCDIVKIDKMYLIPERR